MAQPVLVQPEGPVRRVVLNRPERRNAMSLALLGELEHALETIAADREARVVVIEGAGVAFSAGHDMSEMIEREPEFYRDLFGTCTRVMQSLHRIPQPVIAKVHGVATAAGCQLVASCDLVVASDDASFGTPGVKIGLFCTTPMVPVTRAIGRKRAMELLLTGETIDARTAMDWGLVNRVVAAESLDDEVEKLIEAICRHGSAVIAAGKRAFYEQVGLHEDEAYDVTLPLMASGASAVDATEGFSAFLGKRAPVWSDEVAAR